eukprot:Skav206834  [mRNA]  locus=scaffold3672:211538:213768:- [translate_table: standard]
MFDRIVWQNPAKDNPASGLHTSRETAGKRQLRLQHAETRKIRRLCGWNVYQRSELERQSVGKEEYKTRVKELGVRWRSMTDEEREPYNLEAELQQNRVDTLAKKPLPNATQQCSDGVVENEETDGVWRNARKKVSLRRLSLNINSFKNHELWNLPTQFGDGSGALRSELIDVAMSDKDISAALDKTLHHNEGEGNPTTGDDGSVHIHAQCLPFLCKKDPHFDAVLHMVKKLAHFIKDSRVKPGHLLVFSDGSNPEQAYFLGAMLQKPMLQSLVEATIDHDEAHYKVASGKLSILTGHEIFLAYIRAGGENLDSFEITVTAWKCQAWLDMGHLRVNPMDVAAEVNLTLKPSQQKSRKQQQLSFFQKIRPKMPRTKVQKPKPKTKQRSQPRGSILPDLPDASDLPLSDGSSSASTKSDSDVSDDFDDVHQESEKVIPATDTVAREEKSLRSLAEEVESSNRIRETLAQAVQAKQTVPRSTFFSKERGLHEAGLAASGRSICLGCKQPIPRGSLRYSWFHSCFRPHGWLHAHCALAYIRSADKELWETSVKHLNEILANAPRDSEIFSWTTKILEALNKAQKG